MKQIKQVQKYRGNVYAVMFARLLMMILVFSLSRILIYIFNPQLFGGFSYTRLLQTFFYGLRFDWMSISILSAFFVIGNSIPFGFRRNKIYQKALNIIVLVVMSIGIILNMIDVIYYRFTLKRMTFDIFNYFNKNGGFTDVVPGFVLDFWYISSLSIVLIGLMIFLFYSVGLNRKIEKTGWRFYSWQSTMFILSMGILLLGIRGGFQLKPLNIVDAGKKVSSSLSSVVLNTPFTIIKSFGQNTLTEKSYFSEQELINHYNPVHSFVPYTLKDDRVENVVILILESFSAEHFGFFTHKKSFTPFLDSLFNHSLVFRAVANGKRSIEGIPAILSSLPTLSDESFVNGPYASNQIEGLAQTLGKYNYQTAFFHGGKNGTMSFDAYAYKAGFQAYYGLDEYPDKEDYDGHWGIWDEQYLSYFAKELNSFSQPFMAALFTLSSHHPYQIPNVYNEMLPEGKIPIQKAIAYTDLSLRNFFQEIKNMEWYSKTLFVITADHTSEGVSLEAQNSLGQFSIPIAFFAPSDTSLKLYNAEQPIQQLDIYPSLLQYLGIKDTVICFGNSIFETHNKAFAVNYFNHKIQFLDQDYMIGIQEDNLVSVYQYEKDSLLRNNLIEQVDYSEIINFERAFIQQYNNRMIRNQLKIRNDD